MKSPVSHTKKVGDFSAQYYDIDGSVPVVIFLHGIAMSKDWSLDYYREAGWKNNMILLDLPGHNGVPMEKIDTFEDIATSIGDFAEDLSLENVVIAGYSLGGMVSLACADILGDKLWLKGVVSWASPILGLSGISERGRIVFSGIINSAPTLYNAANREALLRLGSRLYGLGLTEIEIQMISRFPYESARKYGSMILEYSSGLDMKVPTLLIYGTHDLLVNDRNYEFARQRAGEKCRVERVENGGHVGSPDAWNEVTMMMGSFFEEVGKSGVKR